MAKFQKRVRREYTTRERGVCWVVEAPSAQSLNGNMEYEHGIHSQTCLHMPPAPYLLDLWPCSNYVTFPCCNFLSYIIGMIIVRGLLWELNELAYIQNFLPKESTWLAAIIHKLLSLSLNSHTHEYTYTHSNTHSGSCFVGECLPGYTSSCLHGSQHKWIV